MLQFKQYSPWRDSPHLLLVFVILMVVYVWSMPVTVVLEDDGYFTLAAYFNSVTHPPGYPLFVMLGHLFTWLPVGSVAFRVHLASAVFAALACVCVWYLVRGLFDRRVYAYIAALGLGLSKTFWSQAIIAEVYTLNVLLFVLLFILAICFSGFENHRTSCGKWFAFVFGLALSNHWPLTVLATPALVILLWPSGKDFLRHSLKFVPFLVAGLLPYLWLVWRSHVVPEYSFYGPIQSWQEFWFYISRGHYASFDHSITAGWYDKLSFTGFALYETAVQFGIPGMMLIAIGCICQWLTGNRRLAWSLLLAYLGGTVFLILLRDVDFEFFQRATFRVYPLVSYLAAIIWVVFAIRWLEDKSRFLSARIRRDTVVYALATVVIGGSFLANIEYNYRRHDYLAAEYALTILGSLEQGAIFYANADNIDGPVRYMHAVEKIRPDVTVYTGRYIRIQDTLYRPYQLAHAEFESLVKNLIESTDRPVYFTNDFPSHYPAYRYGFYRKIDRDSAPGSRDKVVLNPRFLARLQGWGNRFRFRNAWDNMHYNLLREDFCELVINVEFAESGGDIGIPGEGFPCNNYQGLLKRLEFAYLRGNSAPAEVADLLQSAGAKAGDAFTREEQARLAYFSGLFALRGNHKQAAMASLEQSLEMWPHPDNPAREPLQAMKAAGN